MALSFVNDQAASTHGNVHVDSIFLSSSGEWRLGGFEVLSNPKDETAVLYVSPPGHAAPRFGYSYKKTDTRYTTTRPKYLRRARGQVRWIDHPEEVCDMHLTVTFV